MKRNLEDENQLKFIALGGGSEVGRSCHIIQYKGKTIMLDAGVHPAYTGMASLPFYDEFDLSTVDILLVSHFHLDHAASLPYVMRHTTFKGRVFMTHPTKAIYRWLLSDFVRVSGASTISDNSDLYTDEDLEQTFEKIEAVDFYSTIEVDGIKFTAYHAGHVLGAAMFFIEIAGVKLLFTGDYSREIDRHLHSAQVPPERPDVLICESTYGTGIHQSRPEKEHRLKTLIHTTLKKGGKCLLPVFALGRAQELLLILDEYWTQHPELDGINIYYASSLARKCMAVYQTFINMMNDSIQKKYRETKQNPFHFKHIKSIRSLDRFQDVGPCVMLASPGMLQNGVSRQLLERWAPDPRNALIVTGYSVEGTMAKQMLNEPADIPSLQNPEVRVPRRMSVEELSFAAHVDFKENSEFIDLVGAPNIILVHGETNNMGRLKSALLSKYSKLKGTPQEKRIYNPKNCFELVLEFKQDKIAKTRGSLATSNPNPVAGTVMSGVLVEKKDFSIDFVAVSDLREYTGLRTCEIMERQKFTVDAGPDLVLYHLQRMFAVEQPSPNTLVVMDRITLTEKDSEWSVEWKASQMNDSLADAVVAVLLGVDTSKASVKLSTKPCDHGAASDAAPTTAAARAQQVCALLEPQFGECLKVAKDYKTATVEIDSMKASIDFDAFTVESSNNALKQRVSHLLNLGANIAAPLA